MNSTITIGRNLPLYQDVPIVMEVEFVCMPSGLSSASPCLGRSVS